MVNKIITKQKYGGVLHELFYQRTYQTKREILNFRNKMTNNTLKITKKLTQDMVYGLLSSKKNMLVYILTILLYNLKYEINFYIFLFVFERKN